MKEFTVIVGSIMMTILLFLVSDLTISTFFVYDPDDAKPYLKLDSGWYELKREFVGIDQWGEKVYPVRTDFQGFRTNVRSTIKDKGDVLFLGDSFTYGINGPWEETFVGMFESYSNRSVLNAGVPSYSPTPYLYHYKKVIESKRLLNPHVVIVGLDMSDVADEAMRWRKNESHPINIRTSEYTSKQAQFFSRHLVYTKLIYRYIRSQFTKKTTPKTIFDNEHTAFTWREWDAIDKAYTPIGIDGGFKQINEAMIDIGALAKENGGQLYILIYPHPAQIVHDSKILDWEEYALNLCKNIGCTGVINTFPIFRDIAKSDADWYQTYYIDGDAHFTAKGNEVVFNEIVKQFGHK
jgi:hypothetical protein